MAAIRRNALLRAQEARESKRRVKEEEATTLNGYLMNDQRLHGNMKYVLRAEGMRREREARLRNAEEHLLEQLYAEHTGREAAVRAELEADAIAAELEQRHKDTERRSLLVQKVREESEELRELQVNLRAAAMNRERSLQQQEKASIAAREQEYDQKFDVIMEDNRRAKVVEVERMAGERRLRNIAAREVLTEQMSEKLDMLAKAKEQYVKERELVDQVVQSIQHEDAAEAARKKAKQAETKEWVSKFLEDREMLREEEKRARMEEEAAIAAYAAEIERRQNDAANAAAKREGERDAIFEKLKQEQEEKERKREEIEELINRLHFEESEARYREQEAEKARKQQQSKLELMQANEFQRQLKAQRKEQERKEEEDFRSRMLQKLAEDDRIEQMNAQRRRMKLEEHKREVERLASIKQAMYDAQCAREVADHDALVGAEVEVAAIVEQERLRLLREYAAELKDFLPKGVIATPSDLALVQRISKKDAE